MVENTYFTMKRSHDFQVVNRQLRSVAKRLKLKPLHLAISFLLTEIDHVMPFAFIPKDPYK